MLVGLKGNSLSTSVKNQNYMDLNMKNISFREKKVSFNSLRPRDAYMRQ